MIYIFMDYSSFIKYLIILKMNTNIQTSELIKNILNPVPKNRKYYKYLGREDEVDGNGNYWYKYTLNGILSLDYYATDMYLLFFRSFYTPLAEKQICKSMSEQNRFKIKSQGTSRFYKEFIRLIYLQSLLGQQSLKIDHIKTLLSDIVRQKQKDIHLSAITKRLLVEYNTHYKSQWQKDKANFCQYKYIKVLRAKIKQQLNIFYTYIQQHLSEIVQEETLPYPINQQSPLQTSEQLLLHVKKAYQNISNIYILSKSKKKKMLENMLITLGRYINVKVNEGERERWYIYLSRLSSDKQTVLTKLQHYMIVRNVSNKTNSISLKQANMVLIRDILSLSKKYFKSVQRFYPLIKADDIIIDQKSLKPILDHPSLIYDALGIHNREASSIQLKLVMSSTPKPIQFQKSYFQLKQDAQWALIRKYFIQRQEKKQKQQEIKSKNEQFQSENSDYDVQQQKYEDCPVKSRDAEQKVHVWRLICIFYKIISSKHLIQTFYNKKYQNLSQDKIPPFQKVLYERALQQLHNQFCKNPEKIQEYLRIKQSLIEQNNFQKFDFRFRQLEKLLKMQQQNDDSLIQKYRFEKSKSELWVRGMLLKQIFEIILKEKYFKRMLNAKKYMIMFSILGMELSYASIYTVWQGEKKIGASKLLYNQLNDQQNQFKKFSFLKQREKEKNNFENINKRLNQYLLRKDDQNKYLEDNKEFQENIKNIYENVIIILRNQKQVTQYEQSNDDKSNQKRYSKQKYYTLINETKVRASRTFNLSSNILNKIVKKELENKLQKIEDFHKIDSKTSNQLLKYITKRFYYLIRAYQTVSPFNFAKYRTFLLPFLLESNSMGLQQISLNSMQNTNQTQLLNLSRRLQQISQILKQHNIMEINESRAIEPKMAY